MKKLYMLMSALLFCTGVYAQTSPVHTIIPIDNGVIPPKHHDGMSGSGGQQLWLEYDSADAGIFSTAQSHQLQWITNKRYPVGYAHPLFYYSFQYCIVRFDSLYDPIVGSAIDNSTVNNILVDSVYAIVSHVNTTNEPDTFIIKIRKLHAKYWAPMDKIVRFPSSTVLYTDTFITNTSLSPGGNWKTSPVQLNFYPNFLMQESGFAIELDYYGSFADTCAFLSGFNNLGASFNCPARANISNFYPNSFSVWTDAINSNKLTPDSTSGYDLAQDCNANGQFDDGIDGYNYLQDIVMGAYITINSDVAVRELKNTGISLSQNIPNPLHTSTDIKYELASNAKDVTLSIYDVFGRPVMQINEGSKMHGMYSVKIDAGKLAVGIYTYTLRADGNLLSKRMIVE